MIGDLRKLVSYEHRSGAIIHVFEVEIDGVLKEVEIIRTSSNELFEVVGIFHSKKSPSCNCGSTFICVLFDEGSKITLVEKLTDKNKTQLLFD
ncbi:hypothetical protein ACIQ1D_02410 [Lysinibacillus xylanilyticus]|jgi:hypothetical protein|uniref:hypothetical protein n=1 Tax=Lysinibacillus xylanilyticus TaxID=582475 RepID=UPI003822A5F8